MSRRPAASIVASPVLVGAVTVLVSIVAVFLAYNANTGLPFVPTYDIKAELPGASNLLASNEVRLGGFRVGIIDEISPGVSDRGERRSIAIAHLKLDKIVEEIPVDSVVRVRPRSALGLKFIEITPGKSDKTFAPGETIPLENAIKPIELDEFFGLNTAEFRRNQRASIQGFGTGLAGRGESINLAIEDFVPLLTHLEPVMKNLGDPRTRFAQFFRESRRFSGQIAPVAPTYAQLFVNMATTFEALSRHPERLRQVIEKSSPTIEQAIKSFPVQRPFLRDTAVLMDRLEPVAREMRRSLPAAADAFEVGAPVLRRAPALYRRTERVLAALEDLAERPTTLLGFQNLRDLLNVATPFVEYVAPYQTVCNYWNYYWNAISEHVSENVAGGTLQRSLSKSDNSTQDNRISSTEADRPADIPRNQPIDAKDPRGEPLTALHTGGPGSAVDAQGKANCTAGQRGYLTGPLVPDGRYPASDDPTKGGGSHVVWDADIGVRYGGTYKARELGIDGVEDVP
ncbi:MAG TPA: MlaD family protein [Thermoleophilaceae bacterium]|nr:MlaD family protein [Thermoleophilaceae bacterium]